MTPASRRAAVQHLIDHLEISERRACRLAGQHRAVQRYVSTRPQNHELNARLEELARERPRFGYRRLGILLRREGHVVNHKRVYRLYTERGLAVRRKTRKRVAQANRHTAVTATARNECWSMDFLSDSMTDGRSLRVFAVVDDHSKLCPAMIADVAIPAERVIRALDRAIEQYGKPDSIRTDNGPEFTSRALDAWAYERGITHHFIRPGKPVENAIAESFNSRVRDEHLNQHCFSSVRHAQDLTEAWREDYNRVRPHSALDGRSPLLFLAETESGAESEAISVTRTTSPEPHNSAEIVKLSAD